MHWQKPDRPGIVYIQGHPRPAWLLWDMVRPKYDFRIIETDVYEPLGDRLVAYIPGPPPEGEQWPTADESEGTSDEQLDNLMHKLRKAKGFCPMTAEEADAAYDAAPAIPMSQDEIDRIVEAVVGEKPECELCGEPKEPTTMPVVVPCKWRIKGDDRWAIWTDNWVKIISDDGESGCFAKADHNVAEEILDQYEFAPADILRLPEWLRKALT